MSQLPLQLPPRPALGRDDFLVGASNAAALAWIDRWPAWPGIALCLVGPPASGKSHLAGVWRQVSGARETSREELARERADRILGEGGLLLVEGADAGLAPEAETQLFHLYNLLGERGGHLLLTGRNAPKRWPVRLPDLASRLATATVAELGRPDDELLRKLLEKLFKDRQLGAGDEVLDYLVRRIPRSFAAARLAVEAIDRYALAERRRITVAAAREALADSAAELEALEE